MVVTAKWCMKAVVVVLVLAWVLSGTILAIESALDGRWGAAALQIIGTSIVISAIVKVRPLSAPRRS